MANETEKDETYFVVYHWMITRLGLKGAALLVYALIYGYTKAVGEFFGSLAYIEERTGLSRKGVINCLGDLVGKELLVKTEIYQNGLKFVKYRAVGGSVENTPPVQKLHQGSVENTPGWCTEYTGGGVESTPNNKDKNKKDNKLYIKDSASPDLQEILEYIWQKQSYVDPEKFYDYYESRGWKRKNGKPIDDWRKLVDEWDEREKQMQQTKPSPVSTAGVGTAKPPKNAPTGESSFDVNDFFAAAVKRSYEDLDGG